MNALVYLVNTVFDIFVMLVILRLWLQFAQADFYNPLSQFVVKVTQPMLAPMRRFIPSFGKIDTAAIVLAVLVVTVKLLLIILMSKSSSINPIFMLLIAMITVIKKAGVMLMWILFIRAILSWVSRGYNPIELVLGQLSEPFLSPIRKFIPPMGGLDFSLLILIVILNFINILLSQYIPFWGML